MNFHRFVFCAAAAALVGAGAVAQEGQSDAGVAALRGDWAGEYVCGQGLTRMTLRILSAGEKLRAYYAFYAHEDNPSVPSGCYEISGDYNKTTGAVRFEPVVWITRPDGYFFVDLEGVYSPSDDKISGAVIGISCTTFELQRVRYDEVVDQLCLEPARVSSLTDAPAASVNK